MHIQCILTISNILQYARIGIPIELDSIIPTIGISNVNKPFYETFQLLKANKIIPHELHCIYEGKELYKHIDIVKHTIITNNYLNYYVIIICDDKFNFAYVFDNIEKENNFLIEHDLTITKYNYDLLLSELCKIYYDYNHIYSMYIEDLQN